MTNQNLTINLLLAFDATSTNIYNWKLKAKEPLSNLLNSLTSYKFLLTSKIMNKQNSRQISIYSNAKQNCLHKILVEITNFQELVQKYTQFVSNLQKIIKNLANIKISLEQKFVQTINQQNVLITNQPNKIITNQLNKIQIQNTKTKQHSNKQKQYQITMMQLVELALSLSNQYISQFQLIIKEIKILNQIFISKYQFNSFSLSPEMIKNIYQPLEILLMHISYETKIKSQQRETWTTQLARIASLRANLHK